MTAWMEKVREALELVPVKAEYDAALTEVEEWERERESMARWKKAYAKGRAGLVQQADLDLARAEAAEAERDTLAEAVGEMLHLIQTRRTSIHMDGTEMFSQPILAQLNGIARAALADRATDGGGT